MSRLRHLATAFAGIGLLIPAAAVAQSANFDLGWPALQAQAKDWQQEGITFQGRYLGEFADNAAGGARQGDDYAGELAFGTKLNLGKLAGLQGGSLDILFTQRQGADLSAQKINNSISVQQIYGGGETLQLTEFTYRQVLFGGKVNVQLGRTELANSFVKSKLYCQFQDNALCGSPYALTYDSSVSIYPIAGWGGRVEFKPFRHVYLKAGIYQDDANVDPDTGHGFTWGLAGSTGFAVPVELGIQRKPKNAAYSDRADIGVIFDRSHFSPAYLTDGPADYGRTMLYGQVQGLAWRPRANKPQGLYLFATALGGLPGGDQAAAFQINAGAVYRGPLPGRPKDDLDFAISETNFTAARLAALYAQRIAAGGAGYPPANLLMFEANYSIQANRWLRVTPNFQYILQPDGDGGGAPFAPYNLPNAVVFGLQFTVNLPHLFGIPGKV